MKMKAGGFIPRLSVLMLGGPAIAASQAIDLIFCDGKCSPMNDRCRARKVLLPSVVPRAMAPFPEALVHPGIEQGSFKLTLFIVVETQIPAQHIGTRRGNCRNAMQFA